ncbi:phosphatase PAP2 family protein [Prolixibacteraceae bacterium Z1-6]|uniref:Phosphatase PAP2 family protein n=1 Tax=Draconibacterium aestuarii TaxID=2998507 RepID=A0A9X3FD39_9BACT|nr:phosphatase PAP2 family protein [Prolixibacteraceae bacterium Z1-6]
MEFLQSILEIDKELFLYLNSFYSDFWDTIMLLVTRKETWFPFYTIILFYLVKNYRSKSVLIIFALILLIVASDQLSVLMKFTVQRFRPVHEPAIQDMVHNVLRKGGLYGFVSSHAANSFALFVFTSRIFKNKSYSVLMLFWALLFCYSRIYSGVHYPLDILGGAILGWLIGVVVYKLLMFIENHFFFSRSPKIGKTALLQVQSGIIWLVFVVLMITIFISTHLLHYYNFL